MQTGGNVGIGRRARLRILWAVSPCGFKSHFPHWIESSGMLIFQRFWAFSFWERNVLGNIVPDLCVGRKSALFMLVSGLFHALVNAKNSVNSVKIRIENQESRNQINQIKNQESRILRGGIFIGHNLE